MDINAAIHNTLPTNIIRSYNETELEQSKYLLLTTNHTKHNNVKTTHIEKIYKPRSGENANECTEEIIPLLTIKVPYKLKRKLVKDKLIVQRIKFPLRSLIIKK